MSQIVRTLILVIAVLLAAPSFMPSQAHAENARAKASAKKRSGKKSKGKKSKRKRRVRYKVIPGDTLVQIAKAHGVRVADISRWNPKVTKTIRPGDTLVIYPKRVPRQRSRIDHIVKRGETLGGIAKKYKVDVDDVLAWNRRLHPRKLPIGKAITIYRQGPANRSSSRGRANQGRLVNAEKLTTGLGYYVRSPRRAYGTNKTIRLLRQVIGKTRRHYGKKAHNLVIGDLSRKTGGHLPPHKSHQTGRDVDVSYYIKGLKNPKRFHVATPKNLDVAKTWKLFKNFLATKQVKYIFVNYDLQKALYDYAKKHESKKLLDRVFQYPRGIGASKGIIRHSRGHDDHFHIRFTCDKRDKGCR